MENRSQNPVLPIVVVIVSDTIDSRAGVSHLTGCLKALNQQVDPPPMEIIIPYHPRVEGMEKLQRRFPDVNFMCLNGLEPFADHSGSRERIDQLRGRGLAAARGDILALLEGVGRPDAHWYARIVEAHRQSYAAVVGAIENGLSYRILTDSTPDSHGYVVECNECYQCIPSHLSTE